MLAAKIPLFSLGRTKTVHSCTVKTAASDLSVAGMLSAGTVMKSLS
jgi:hypothetical protein